MSLHGINLENNANFNKISYFHLVKIENAIYILLCF